MYIIDKNGMRSEITVKKSRFIASVYYVETEDDIKEKLADIKKEFYDAKHYVYAYAINNKKKMSDDGEPQGTGGKPILSLIEGKEITNILIIVTRYFGGILLGTGGLTHAYQNAAKDALDKIELKKLIQGKNLNINIPYDKLELIKKYLSSINNVQISNIEYGEIIKMDINLPIDLYDSIIYKIKDVTSGDAEVKNEKNITYYL